MIDSIIGVGLGEVLNVDRPGVVVALDGEDVDITDLVLNHLSDGLSVLGDLLCCVVPDVMGRVVANPGDEVCLQSVLIICNEVKHTLKSDLRDIAVVVTPLTSKSCAIDNHSRSIIPAANWEIALGWLTLLIFKVDMKI